MKIFEEDPLFDGQLLRALNHVYYGGADVGEYISTAQRIKNGNIESWYRAWFATAERIMATADGSKRAEHTQ